MTDSSSDIYLALALEEAQLAFDKGEVPVGAVIVQGERVLARAHNQKEGDNDVTAHAEILAIRRAAEVLGDWRLDGCTLYSTLEPCVMCGGAILHARLEKIVFGAKDFKWGACGTVDDCLLQETFNHKVDLEYRDNLACSQILSTFFKGLRQK